VAFARSAPGVDVRPAPCGFGSRIGDERIM